MRQGLRLPEHCRNWREELSSCDVADLRCEFGLQAPLLHPQARVAVVKLALSGWMVRLSLEWPRFEPGIDC